MDTFGNDLSYLRIPGVGQKFQPRQVRFHPAQPDHKGNSPLDHLIRSGYYEVSQGAFGTHVVPATLVYFTK